MRYLLKIKPGCFKYTSDIIVPSALPRTNLEKQLLIRQAMQLQNEMIAELEAENEQLKTENAEAKPKEAYYDTLIERGDSTNLRNTAKELGLPEKQFIKQLQLDKFLYRDTRKNFYSTYILIFAFLKITCKKT